MATLLLAVARAQDWGLTGAWELLAPTSADQGPALAYRGATHTTGSLFVIENNTDAAVFGGQIYDVARQRWEAWPSFADLVPMGDPFSVACGGPVGVSDEQNMTAVAFIDSSAARSTVGYRWSTPQMSSGPSTRVGERFFSFGPIIYTFGGAEVAGASAGTFHNDLWALPAGAMIAASQPPADWSQVAQDGTPGFPPGRVAYSWAVFGTVVLMFGGVSLAPGAPPGTLPDVCFSPATASRCEFHSHVWQFQPGNPGPPGEMAVAGSQWALLAANGGAAPAGRFDHISGVLGDQMFVFGGTTAAGPSTELWAYNLPAQAWGLVRPSSPSPFEARRTDSGYPVGAFLGRHFYVYAQAIDVSGEPVPGSGALWRWAPAPGGGGGAPAAPAATLGSGATAALVLLLLVGLVNLALLAQQRWPQLGDAAGACWRGARLPGGAAGGAGGFYTSAGATANGGYAAPVPEL